MTIPSLRRPAAELTIVFIVLFQELALIRWLSGKVRRKALTRLAW